LIEDENGVCAGRDCRGDFFEIQGCLGVAGGQDERGALAFLWTDRAEDIG
jgi:hypothetical protein